MTDNTDKKEDTDKNNNKKKNESIERNLFNNFEDNEFFEAQEQQNDFNDGKITKATFEKEKVIRKAREIMRTSDV